MTTSWASSNASVRPRPPTLPLEAPPLHDRRERNRVDSQKGIPFDMLTPRECVPCAINHEEPDRLRIFFGTSSPTTMLAAAYEKFKTYLGVQYPPRLLSKTFQYAELDEEVMVRCGSDGRLIQPWPLPAVLRRELSESNLIDDWGANVGAAARRTLLRDCGRATPPRHPRRSGQLPLARSDPPRPVRGPGSGGQGAAGEHVVRHYRLGLPDHFRAHPDPAWIGHVADRPGRGPGIHPRHLAQSDRSHGGRPGTVPERGGTVHRPDHLLRRPGLQRAPRSHPKQEPADDQAIPGRGDCGH